MQQADQYLHAAGIICPPVTPELLDLYLANMDIPKDIQHICLFGPESTGKSTLAEKLAAHFNAPLVPEYAKELIEKQHGKISAADMPRIAAGQHLARQRAQTGAKDIVINDTDVLTTTIWSRFLYQTCPTWIDDLAASEKPALTFLMDIDTPWIDDIHRYLPDDRQNFLDACKAALDKAGRPYILLSGTWQQKFDAACRAIEALQQTQSRERTGT
jgi:NadR type nicotinamide-nucleotide adenylyltransferase